METLLPLQWILSRTSQTFQHPQLGWNWAPPVTRPKRTHGPPLEENVRQGVKCLKLRLWSSVTVFFKPAADPWDTQANSVACFYAPGELSRVWISEFHCSQRALQSSSGTKATQVLTPDPSHAPSAIFPGPGYFPQFWRVVVEKRQLRAGEEAFRLTHLSGTWLELRSSFGAQLWRWPAAFHYIKFSRLSFFLIQPDIHQKEQLKPHIAWLFSQIKHLIPLSCNYINYSIFKSQS